MNVTLVLDESGSMSGLPMDLLKETSRALAASLRAGDKVSMVTWDVENAVVLGSYAVDGPSDPVLLAKINALNAGGGTNLEGGLAAGYDLAQQTYDAERINRIVLISDGGANVGITDEEMIGEHAKDNNAEGIYMVGVGVGEANYNDTLMDAVTDAGKGASVFVPDEEEAWKIFGDDFVNTMSVAARDVQVRIDLPPGFKFITFSGEEMSEDPEEVEPQNIAPNDSMIFHQTISSCAPQLLDDASEFTVTVTYKDAITFGESEISDTLKFSDLLLVAAPQLHKGRALFAYTEAIKAIKKGDGEVEVAYALSIVDEAETHVPGDPDLAEIRAVLEAL
jgi:Ca-activated chloride channel family protein